MCVCHNDARDEAGDLAAMALTPSHVSCEPNIFYGTDVVAGQESVKVGSASNAPGNEARGDVDIRGLWKKGETCISDLRTTVTAASSYRDSSSTNVLETAAKVKKDKYLQACLERRRTFTPLVYSVDGMTAKEAQAFEKRVASLLATKTERQHREMVGFIHS